MNFRIVLHLFKTDWRHLKWLIAATWLLILLAAWPVWSFSPAHFDMPPPMGVERIDPYSGNIPAYLKLSSPVSLWTQLALRGALIGAILLLAGALGFHAKGWTAGRPTRRRETILAKALGLGVLLILPLIAVTFITGLIQGTGPAAAFQSGAQTAATLVPRIIGACLFGTLCGGGWRWLAGILALLIGNTVLPLIFFYVGIPWFSAPFGLPRVFLSTRVPWFSDPLGMIAPWQGPTLLWIVAALLAVLLRLTSHHMAPFRRIGLALAVLWLVPPWLIGSRSLYPAPLAGKAKELPDWSATVRPVLAQPSLAGRLSRDSDRSFPGPLRSGPLPDALQMTFRWQASGLPAGAFADWSKKGRGELRLDEETTADLRGTGGIFFGTEYDLQPIAAALGTSTESLQQSTMNHFGVDGYHMQGVFEPVTPGRFKSASLAIELAGTAYRFDKLLDVPLGPSVGVEVEGMRLQIRRLDPEGKDPWIDISAVINGPGWQGDRRYIIGGEWLGCLYLPESDEYRLLNPSSVESSLLAPGCAAVRLLYRAGSTAENERPDLSGFETARFILLRRTDLGKMQSRFVSDRLPLTIEDLRDDGSIPPLRSNESPPLDLRPDPATATDEEVTRWLRISYSAGGASGWNSRNLADYANGHLDQLLTHTPMISPPSSSEGEAIALSVPESRRGKILEALSFGNQQPEYNWLPDLLIRRGWTREAAPWLSQLAARSGGRNPYALIALASLEDPQTYPILVAAVEKGVWFEVYEKIRRLPGIEPALSEALARRYRKTRSLPTRSNGRPTACREMVGRCVMPAANGLPEAFADLLARVQAPEAADDGIIREYLTQVMQIPDEPDWRVAHARLASKSPADFRYDTLSRLWIPIETPH